MNCPLCYATAHEGDEYCRSCGERIATATNPPEILSVGALNSPNEPISPVVPYATLALYFLGCLILTSATIFSIAQAITLGDWSATKSTAVLMVIVIFLANGAKKTLQNIKALQQGHLDSQRRTRSFLKSSVVILFLTWLLLGYVGWDFGDMRREETKLVSDVKEYKEIGGRISRGRSGSMTTFADYITAYEGIEADIKSLGKLVPELRTEFAHHAERYPASRKSVEDWQKDLNITDRRVNLLLMQIAVMKKVKVADPNSQATIWREELLPLAKQEEILDTDLKR